MDPNFILNLSQEERAELAKHMVSPVRCGGLFYDESGRPYYKVGKRRVAPDEYVALCQRLSEGTDG